MNLITDFYDNLLLAVQNTMSSFKTLPFSSLSANVILDISLVSLMSQLIWSTCIKEVIVLFV